MITALQHVGVGVRNAPATFEFYKKYMGFSLQVSDHTMKLEGGGGLLEKPTEVRTLLAMNWHGGGMLELFENRSEPIVGASRPATWADIGYLELGLKAFRLDDLVEALKRRGLRFLGPILELDQGEGALERSIYLRDPEGLVIQLVEEPGEPAPGVGGVRHVAAPGVGGVRHVAAPGVGGVRHVAVGVSDLAASRAFWGEGLGFTRTVGRYRGCPAGMNEVTGGLEAEILTLQHPGEARSNFPSLEKAMVKLVHVPGRARPRLSDGLPPIHAGLIEVSLDLVDYQETAARLAAAGIKLLVPFKKVSPGPGASAQLAYTRDPDGNLVELLEVTKAGGIHPRWTRGVFSLGIKLASFLERLSARVSKPASVRASNRAKTCGNASRTRASESPNCSSE